MTVDLVLPRSIGLKTEFAFEIRHHHHAVPPFPRELEILVLEGVVEADRARIVQAGSEVHAVDAGPVDRAHAHRAGSAIDVNLAALQHLGPRWYPVGRSRRARDQLKRGAGVVAAAEQGLGIETSRGVHDCCELGMEHRNSREENAVLSPADDLAIPDDDGSERTAPSLLDRLDREPRGLLREQPPVHTAPSPSCLLGPAYPGAAGESAVCIPAAPSLGAPTPSCPPWSGHRTDRPRAL